MLRCLFFGAMFLAIATAAGCRSGDTVTPAAANLQKEAVAQPAEPGRSLAASPPGKANAVESAEASKDNVAAAKSAARKPGSEESQSSETSTASTTKHDDKGAVNESVTSVANESAKPDARVAILTPGGPLVMDVELQFDGKPQREPFEKLIDEVLAAGDAEKKQEPTWKGLAANEEFLKKQNEKTPLPARELKQWTEHYDVDRDGQIQRDEAAAWLGRKAGRSMKAFSLRSSRMYFSAPGASSRIWKLLDVDDDGQLSAAELERCAATLTAFDDDDDGAVTADEFATIYEQIRTDAGRMATVDRSRTAFAALNLTNGFPNDRLEYLLTDLYAPQQLLQPASFPELQKEFQSLDANQDGQLDQDEIAGMRTMKPQLKVTVNFASAAGEKPAGAPALACVNSIPELGGQRVMAPNRALFKLGETRLIFSADEIASAANGENSVDVAAVHLMVHDQCDALFELLDANSDGRLGERDIATAARTLAQYDVDHDGQLQSSELPYSMIVAFLRGERADSDGFYRPQFKTASQNSTAVPTWFVRADFNADGDISRREFLGSSDQFMRLDQNGDGFISGEEATASGEAQK